MKASLTGDIARFSTVAAPCLKRLSDSVSNIEKRLLNDEFLRQLQRDELRKQQLRWLYLSSFKRIWDLGRLRGTPWIVSEQTLGPTVVAKSFQYCVSRNCLQHCLLPCPSISQWRQGKKDRNVHSGWEYWVPNWFKQDSTYALTILYGYDKVGQLFQAVVKRCSAWRLDGHCLRWVCWVAVEPGKLAWTAFTIHEFKALVTLVRNAPTVVSPSASIRTPKLFNTCSILLLMPGEFLSTAVNRGLCLYTITLPPLLVTVQVISPLVDEPITKYLIRIEEESEFLLYG